MTPLFVVGGIALAVIVLVVLGKRALAKEHRRYAEAMVALGLAIESPDPLRATGTHRGRPVVIEEFWPRKPSGDGVVVSQTTRIRVDGVDSLPEVVLTSRDYDALDKASPTGMRILTLGRPELQAYEIAVRDDRGAELLDTMSRVPTFAAVLTEADVGRLEELTVFAGQVTMVLRGRAYIGHERLRNALDAAVTLIELR